MIRDKYYLHFDGLRSYIEIPDSRDFSLPTTGSLAVSAWIRPSTLTFPSTEGGGEAYIHWLGKGEERQQEWVFRIYSADNDMGRANRISFYVFNLDGGLGVGSHYQDPSHPVEAGAWIHVVGAADAARTYLYINGQPADSDVYQGQIQPQRGTSPVRIGTRDFHSFFEGDIREVRVWKRALTGLEILGLYNSDLVPGQGLVAEFLLTQDIARDTAEDHDGEIISGTWMPDTG